MKKQYKMRVSLDKNELEKTFNTNNPYKIQATDGLYAVNLSFTIDNLVITGDTEITITGIIIETHHSDFKVGDKITIVGYTDATEEKSGFVQLMD